jgi:aryl-alcohol dehydrogenase-like predicted oxidoreductase
MQRRKLGVNGPEVSAIGLGCMGMSGMYGPSDEAESVATIQMALERGVNLLDTGDFYGMGHNELLIRKAIDGRRDQAFIAVKFGAMRAPDGSFIGLDVRPEAVKNSLSYTLQRLGTDYVDLYQPARVDSRVPIEETVGAIKELVQQGYVRHLGISEASADTLRRAHKVHPVSALQIEYSLMSRGIESETLPATQELGVAITAYGVLSRGLLSGSRPSSPQDFRAHLPRFTGENLQRNQKLVDALGVIASEHNATTSQIAIAWVAARGGNVIPLVGARSRKRLEESLGAIELKLSPEDLARMEAAVPAEAVAGTRYSEDQMAWLDSERAAAR